MANETNNGKNLYELPNGSGVDLGRYRDGVRVTTPALNPWLKTARIADTNLLRGELANVRPPFDNGRSL